MSAGDRSIAESNILKVQAIARSPGGRAKLCEDGMILEEELVGLNEAQLDQLIVVRTVQYLR